MAYATFQEWKGSDKPLKLWSTCDCSGEEVLWTPIQCVGCTNNCGIDCEKVTEKQTQQRIWNTVRTDSSIYTMNLATQNVMGDKNNEPIQNSPLEPTYYGVNWNQMSDRNRASQIPITMNVPRNKVRHRPGASGSGGHRAAGVDVKHDSYARYLARKKGKELRTKPADILTATLPEPLTGNKKYVLGFINNCVCTA